MVSKVELGSGKLLRIIRSIRNPCMRRSSSSVSRLLLYLLISITVLISSSCYTCVKHDGITVDGLCHGCSTRQL